MSKFKKSLISNFKALFWALLIAGVIRTFFIEPFKIPSGSMKPNLLIGDFLFVSKWDYGYSRYSFPFGLGPIKGKIFEKEPKIGDVIVFKLPPKNKINYVKRLVGLPGDTIKVEDGIIYVKNKNSDGFVSYQQKEIKPFYDDQNGNLVQQLKENNNIKNYNILNYSYPNFSSIDNTKEFFIPDDHYFFMGDNRDQSSDSRDPYNTVGFVPKENIIGKVRIIFISFEKKFKLRFERFFKKIF